MLSDKGTKHASGPVRHLTYEPSVNKHTGGDVQKVSIIIPVYNGSKHIRDIFDVLARFAYRDFEVIFVVDKKTNDDSLELIESEKGRVAEVKVLMQREDTRLGGARNEGLKAAEGDIIWFLDVDDRPLPDILDHTVSVMNAYDADTVMFNSVRSFSRDIDVPEKRYCVDIMEREEALSSLLDLRLPVTAWSKMIRKKVLVDNGIEFTHGLAEDIEHTYLTVNSSERICFCERPMYIYIQNPESICNSGKQNNLRGRSEIAAYGRLEALFSEDERTASIFRKRSALIRIRSAVHMDKENFMEYAKSGECREMKERCLRGSLSPEVVLFKISPSLYYSLASYYMNNVFYRDGKYFRKPRRG